MKPKYDNLVISNYKISTNENLLDKKYGITPEIKKLIAQTHEKVINKDKNVLPSLFELIEKYPNVPHFKNYLYVYYGLKDDIKKANKINHRITIEHPDYLFGKIALAQEYIQKKQYDKVPEILGKNFELQSLYPERDEFHINEVCSFLMTTTRYFIGIEEPDVAKSHLDVLKKVYPEHEYIEDLEYQLIVLNLNKSQKRFKEERKMSRSVKPIAKIIIPQTDKKPIFTNQIIEILYENSFDIDHSIIGEILSLSSETLIDDLHKVIYDCIARYTYFRKRTKFDEKTHTFIFHALFLLTELKSEKSLPVILDLLSQNEKFIDYWFGDFLTELIWRNLYELGFNRLEELKNFMKEPDKNCYCRTEVSAAVLQICLHHPERRIEIVNWYHDLFDFYIKNKDNDRIIDTDLIGLMVGDVLDINGKELKQELIELYSIGLALDFQAGTINDVLKELETPYKINYKREILNIYQYYDFILKRFYKNKETKKNILKNIPEPKPYKEPLYIAGRNEPCPCGSGKKYKKCHGSTISLQ